MSSTTWMVLVPGWRRTATVTHCSWLPAVAKKAA